MPVATLVGVCIAIFVFMYFLSSTSFFSVRYIAEAADSTISAIKNSAPKYPPLDKAAYDAKMLQIANMGTTTLSVATTTATSSGQATTTVKKPLWPVTTAPYPNDGAILPFKRIVAYYGNFYSTKMGVLGEYPEDVMLQKLKDEKARWEAADPTTPVQLAINYIDITAQGSPGKDGKYRLRMPDSQIDKAIAIAAKVDGIVILDLQVGLSDLKTELPLLDDYWKMPQVHIALDPEFSMKSGDKPGSVIGTYDAADINYAANYLAKIVRDNNLPPKVMIVHRFTQSMVTNAKKITPLPEVQIVMDMDGWGPPEKKIGTYKRVIYPEPVQFVGFKLFYKNDLKPPSTRLMTPEELLKLSPQPLFIQYQ